MAASLPPSLKESVENTKVDYRQLGKSGLRISVPIFGCMSFGDPKAQSWALDEDEVKLATSNSPMCVSAIDTHGFPDYIRRFRSSRRLMIGD